MPSNCTGMLGGVRIGSLADVERRAEAIHAARKIHERLRSLSPMTVHVLSALYTERPWPKAVVKKLGVLAGPMEGLPIVRAEHLRALARGRTKAKTVTAWLEEVVLAAEAAGMASWRDDAERACALAVYAYEQVRGDGESVAPTEEVG